jgi:hypothetical protein
MKSSKWLYISYSIAWLATGIAVLMAVYITKSAKPLWAMLIPGCLSVTNKGEHDSKNNQDREGL